MFSGRGCFSGYRLAQRAIRKRKSENLWAKLAPNMWGWPSTILRMTPYYELAEELDIPVGIHASGGPPLTAERCCPDFRLSIGDPALLEEVLVQYPRLRVFIMHANVLTYPGLLRMLQQFPHVYVDVTIFSTILPREGFHHMLRTYKRHGLLDRIHVRNRRFPCRRFDSGIHQCRLLNRRGTCRAFFVAMQSAILGWRVFVRRLDQQAYGRARYRIAP